ncbi:hypothetical protein [Xanthomonas euvesicatoria]|uniref:hypothetical protein n=1 Tax=Xanthomonas euvesicatoria TaxID=456327 RepID=UPI0002266A64|nr:hypothetical protein [Xanthomonas euvesicatoria]AEO42292.1 hypothetical protein XACM_2020 [Xanthomonas euvesicatoria pv. citrumelo F1]PPU89662.1 hypothetical protein XaclCFBP3371_05735 [Xanthomonas euvesicatoria pv. citrumelonis]TKA17329.1 hypothetical protein TN51_10230 [Xanthomonas euvesicatoria pv. citrumelonis]
MKIRCLALCAAAFSHSATAADDKVYLEFLWDARPPHSIARQQTIQFLTDGQHTHQVCVATNLAETDVGGLVVKAFDASGQEVSSHQYPDYRGVKHCYDADLGQGGKPGLWTFRASTGDGRTGEETLQVHARLADSPLSNDPGTPYVVGRPNYDAAIPPAGWHGRLIWEMQVNPQGTVTGVTVVTAEGVGLKLRSRAIAAGYLSLFFPDQRRARTPLLWRRELLFEPE